MRFVLGLIATTALAFAGAVHAREIALTFDDAPIPDSAIMTGDARTPMLIEALRKAGVEQAAFFAVPRSRTPAELARLTAYARAGHLIANHSNTHPNLRNLTAEEYLADIAAAHASLKTMPNFRAWFRFPFLSEGETRDKRDTVRAGLIVMNYAQGYVTVDNYDWYLNALANDAKKAGKTVDQTALRDLYVETLMDCVKFYDDVAVKALGRSPRHVLLLHENDLAAQFIGDLVAALRKDGWTIVTPTAAYEDPIAKIAPDTLFLGQGRVAAIAHTAGMKPAELVPESEEESVLDKRFMERVLKQP
ncbi:MAG: polysaccharide deacetylase family protein [Alphaproteobacteria bacterium]|jgi:peptidoglycan/xylan/chitin deacetylase (PgdA/CDA1 family)|nr:polysaccharide deacetylase family protein [Alphaproteobacteria bacterium]